MIRVGRAGDGGVTGKRTDFCVRGAVYSEIVGGKKVRGALGRELGFLRKKEGDQPPFRRIKLSEF